MTEPRDLLLKNARSGTLPRGMQIAYQIREPARSMQIDVEQPNPVPAWFTENNLRILALCPTSHRIDQANREILHKVEDRVMKRHFDQETLPTLDYYLYRLSSLALFGAPPSMPDIAKKIAKLAKTLDSNEIALL